MKRKRFLKLLGISVVLTLLVSIFLPVSPVFAASVTLDPDEGMVGDEIDIEGSGFSESDSDNDNYVYVDVYFTSGDEDGDKPTTSCDIDDEITTYELVDSGVDVDDDGEFDTSIDIPERLRDGSDDEDVSGGTYYICITYEDSDRVRAVRAFTVIAGEITDFDPDSGPVGTEVDVSGENFAEKEDLTIKFDDYDITDDIASGDAESDSSGDIEFSIIIPPSTAGKHTITVSDESMSEVEETFTVEPEITSVTPASAPPGDAVTVEGTGFGKRKEADIILNGATVASATTDAEGSFSTSFTVPDISEGIYSLSADDGTNDAATNFTVEIGTAITVSPQTTAAAPGYVGQSVTISGVAFKPNTTVTITYASNPQVLGTTPTNAKGNFSYTFKVPKSPAGAHTISASDGVSSLQIPFYMESDAPPEPQPILPEIGTKAPAITGFDWGDVNDDSGVTYTLQVATSVDFSSSSIVLAKDGLNVSDYSLSKEEALPSRPAKAPYYWRVRATDDAGNESDWTAAHDFSVGKSLPSWAPNLFWGLGVAAAAFVGYLMGKRRSYY